MPSQSKRDRALTDLIETLWSNYSISRGRGGHTKIRLRRGPHARVITAACTPGDRRGDLNFLRDLRRAVAELRALPLK
ncbi:MAG: hypothetical protein K8F25_10540 [Fimbriimonadaceae bacterium]|nr:hypothetical protein [Alphaproteobacteria bacterium]